MNFQEFVEENRKRSREIKCDIPECNVCHNQQEATKGEMCLGEVNAFLDFVEVGAELDKMTKCVTPNGEVL